MIFPTILLNLFAELFECCTKRKHRVWVNLCIYPLLQWGRDTPTTYPTPLLSCASILSLRPSKVLIPLGLGDFIHPPPHQTEQKPETEVMTFDKCRDRLDGLVGDRAMLQRAQSIANQRTKCTSDGRAHKTRTMAMTACIPANKHTHRPC